MSNKLRCEKPGCRTLVDGGGLCSEHDGSAEARERRRFRDCAEAELMVAEIRDAARAILKARHDLKREALYHLGRVDGRRPALREEQNESR